MINKLISFPIWKSNCEPVIKLNDVQKRQVANLLSKLDSGEYRLLDNPCLCGNTDPINDILISEKDRYGISCENVLCKRCGLIRLKRKLDDRSTAEFYKNEYRDIYVGKELAGEEFFNSQAQRGETFYKLIKRYISPMDISSVFEIGCGAGGILYPFWNDGKNVSGCDFGEKYLRYGRSKGLDLYHGELDVHKTPTLSQDLVILSHVMEHLNEPIKTMNKIIEIIGNGKYLLVEVPGIFDIKKTYFNPILYFQSAHVYNYYYYYLKVLFEELGMNIIYGDERCTFLLQKPIEWVPKNDLFVYDENMVGWAKKIESEIKRRYISYILKLNPYYLRSKFVHLLDLLGVKGVFKKVMG